MVMKARDLTFDLMTNPIYLSVILELDRKLRHFAHSDQAMIAIMMDAILSLLFIAISQIVL